MIEAYKKFFANYANFKGVATRSDYWWVVLANFLIGFVIGFVCGLLPDGVKLSTTISSIYSLVILIPSLAIFTRRLHDIGKSGWNWLWCFIPIVGSIVVLVFLCLPSVNENNKYKTAENL